MFMVI